MFERCVVVYDVAGGENENDRMQTAQLYNNPERAAEAIREYCDHFRPDRCWKLVNDPETISKMFGNGVVSLFGWRSDPPKDDDIPDMITLYRAKIQDPENDPYLQLTEFHCKDIDEIFSRDKDASEMDILVGKKAKELTEILLTSMQKIEKE